MPVAFSRLRLSKTILFKHTCDHPGCNSEAPFGFECNPRLAFQALTGEAGPDVEKARKLAGRWFCMEHRNDGYAVAGDDDAEGSVANPHGGTTPHDGDLF